MKGKPSLAAIPVIVITAFPTDEHRVGAAVQELTTFSPSRLITKSYSSSSNRHFKGSHTRGDPSP